MDLALPMYNVHSYFPSKNLGKKVCIIHSKIWYMRLLGICRGVNVLIFCMSKRYE